jgi:hypothetical protein
LTHHSYDPASLEILEQLGQVKQLLQTQSVHTQSMLPGLQSRLTDSHAGSLDLSSEQYGSPLATSPASHHDRSHGLGYVHHHGDEARLLSKSLKFETSTCNAENILDWSIFAGKYSRQEVESMIFNPEQSSEASITSTQKSVSRADRGINDQDALELIDKFLVNVHIKNPIFSVDDVKRMGKQIMEYGFDWDARSCFVVFTAVHSCTKSLS